MKCAKCGNEVSADAPCCPWCEAGAKPLEPERTVKSDRYCPVCGAEGVPSGMVRSVSGCGCLGLPGGFRKKVGMTCRNCGAVWERDQYEPMSFCGCLFWLIFWTLFILVFKAVF